MDQKKAILVVLLLVFGLSLAYRIMNPFEQQRVGRLKYRKSVVQSDSSKKKGINPFGTSDHEMIISFFRQPPIHRVSVIRDPFLGENKSPRAQPEDDTKHRPAQLTPPPPKPQDPRERIKRELSKFRVFGFFESDGKVTLFLEKGRNIIIARKGDWIEGRFQVSEITADSLKLRIPEIDEYVHIDLSE